MFYRTEKHNRMDGSGQKRCKERLGEQFIHARHKWFQENCGGPARLQGDQTKPRPTSVWIENKLTVLYLKRKHVGLLGTGKKRDHRNQ